MLSFVEEQLDSFDLMDVRVGGVCGRSRDVSQNCVMEKWGRDDKMKWGLESCVRLFFAVLDRRRTEQ